MISFTPMREFAEGRVPQSGCTEPEENKVWFGLVGMVWLVWFGRLGMFGLVRLLSSRFFDILNSMIYELIRSADLR